MNYLELTYHLTTTINLHLEEYVDAGLDRSDIIKIIENIPDPTNSAGGYLQCSSAGVYGWFKVISPVSNTRIVSIIVNLIHSALDELLEEKGLI